MDGTVLVADDDRTIRTVLTQALTRAGCKVHATASLTTLMRWVEEGRGDLVISDVVMPDGNGLESLPRIAELRKDLPVIIISAQNTIMTAIQAAEAAAYDYLPKPFDLPDLMKRSARALERNRQPRGGVAGPSRGDDLPLVGRTPVMQALYKVLARVINTDLPMLFTGESGTGKSLIAKAIHDNSDRRGLPFVVVSTSDLTNPSDIAAAFARAKTGTIVFDEISDLPPEVQSHLVRAVDGLGETAPRLMATSQVDVDAQTQSGAFRQDLFYRLSTISLNVPALRLRVDDIAPLTDHFLQKQDPANREVKTLSQEALKILAAATWPGNVRQLENAIRRLVATCPETEITAEDVTLVLGQSLQPASPGFIHGTDKLSASIRAHLEHYFDLHGGELPPSGLYGRVLREMEYPLIELALEACNGNQAKCSGLLGINRNTLRKKITEMDIRVTRRRKLM